MYRLFLINIFILSYINPLFAQNNDIKMNIDTAFITNNTLGFTNDTKYQNGSNIAFNLGYLKNKFSSQLSLNFEDYDKLNFDNSFVDYQIGIINFNIGKIDRIWSFSNKSSLILSSNARPLEAFSIKLENKFNTNWLPSNAKWSIEAINSSTKRSYNGGNSLLTGARVLLSPTERLNFEIFQTSQWGGKNNKFSPSVLNSILFGDTNDGSNATINKMAGFGISYSILLNEHNYRIYGQVVGEDESGNLPSCYSWMSGIELLMSKIKFPTMATIELIDTRVAKTKNGFCGPDTMYNNNTYDYINYNKVLGVPIDSEATSYKLFINTEIHENLIINYSINFLTINDNNYSQNRLSSKRRTGTITSVGLSWEKNNLKIGGDLSYQDLALDKANIKKGMIFGLRSSIAF